MPGGYGPPPQMLVSGDTGYDGLLQRLATQLTMGTGGPVQMPNTQGAGTSQAYQMAGPVPPPSVQSGNGIPMMPLMPSPQDILSGGSSGGGGAAEAPNNRFSGAASGAAAGSQLGPWGALVGGIVGYGANGGVKDANPIDASGFSGKGMEQAFRDQDLARIFSNPGAAIISKAASSVGVDEDSFHGKALQAGLDPAAFLGGLFRSKHGDEKRNMKAFLQAFPETTVMNYSGQEFAKLPNGTLVPRDQLQEFAGTWYGATYAPDGNQDSWQRRYNDMLSNLYLQPQPFLRPGG